MKKSLFLLLSFLLAMLPLHARPLLDTVSTPSVAADSIEVAASPSSTLHVTVDNDDFVAGADADFTPIDINLNATAALIKSGVVAICSVLIFTAGCIAFVWLLLYYRRRQHLDKLEIVSKSLDLNRPLPKEFFHTGYRPTQRNLTRGIFWIGAGLSLLIFFLVLSIPVWPLGLLIISIGISKIAGYIVATKSENSSSKE